MSRDQYDVIIVGAGIVGSTLACALGGSGLNVAIIEAQTINNEWPSLTASVEGFDPRVSALTVASQQFLQQLNVWSLIQQQRVSAYRHMHVWDADGTGSIDFNAADINQPALGHIVENRLTATALIHVLQQQRNIDIIAPVKVASMTALEAGGYQLVLADGRNVQAPLVVAADGANSFIRQQLQFEMREWDYQHQAIVATVATEKSHQQTAWQRFLPEGPLAFLPLATEADSEQSFCSIVWSAVPDYAQELMAQSDSEFSSSLAAAFEHRLGNIQAVSRRFSFPLRQRHAIDYVKPGIALVGDAAHTIHPLAGQGVNLGLMDVQVLAEEIVRAQARQLDVGSLAVLQRYQRRRKAANLTMMASMEGFKRLFAENALPVRWARNTGMKWLDGVGPLKNRIMRGRWGCSFFVGFVRRLSLFFNRHSRLRSGIQSYGVIISILMP
ncbi:UbiH/UbiF/VisC/COQ6 family ubiquinone biosynthesis hydroxylase [Oceanicoccus sp. KOV_DT_Chl]|uniref:UbiH/UbiF/VisC/COQ6 family ubiquinone biosynthesis hydroxylase n=1 Tax=Oceanicoccus sp. KOV_DT_Chl TaxID=1904639 RepID=UPI000C7DC4F5|nr:UbiH/UbiF/VisC/COQ6 family ubiquinone biosynthesis hydroxylase [Oceanicoccus sp. KOV_DT_Chl]